MICAPAEEACVQRPDHVIVRPLIAVGATVGMEAPVSVLLASCTLPPALAER